MSGWETERFGYVFARAKGEFREMVSVAWLDIKTGSVWACFICIDFKLHFNIFYI